MLFFFCVFCVRPQSLLSATSAHVSGHTCVPDAGLIEGSAVCSPSSSFSCAMVSSSSSINSSDRLLDVAILHVGESVEELADVLGTGVLALADGVSLT